MSKKYNWLFMQQSNRFYPQAEANIPITGIQTDYDESGKSYITTDSFLNIIPQFDEFAKEQREYFKKYCAILGHTGLKPWFLFDEDSNLDYTNKSGCSSGYSTTNKKEVDGNKYSGITRGADGPMPYNLIDMSNLKYHSDGWTVLSPEEYIKKYDGNTSWPGTNQYTMRLRTPEDVGNKLIARQVASRSNDNVTASNATLSTSWLVQDYGNLDESLTVPLAYLLGSLKFTSVYQSGVDTIMVIRNTAGFQIVDDTFDETNWFITYRPDNLSGWNVKEIRVYDNEIYVRIGSYSISSFFENYPMYLSRQVKITDGGNFNLPKFRWKNGELLQDQSSNNYDKTTYTINDGSLPCFILEHSGTSTDNKGSEIYGYFAVIVETPSGNIFLRMYSDGFNIKSVYPFLAATFSESGATNYPSSFKLKQYRSLHAALSEIDVNNVEFAEANYNNNKWSIVRNLNWFDEMWLIILRRDLGIIEDEDNEAPNTIIVNGKIHYHDRIRVLVDGEFNTDNLIFSRTLRNNTGEEINTLTCNNFNIIDTEWKNYRFDKPNLSNYGYNYVVRNSQYSGWDYIYINYFVKENYSGDCTPNEPSDHCSARYSITNLSDGANITPEDGVVQYEIWKDSDHIKNFGVIEADDGTKFYIPSSEPAYSINGEWIADNRNSLLRNGQYFINRKNKDWKLSPGLIAGDNFWEEIHANITEINITDETSSSGSDIEVKYLVHDIDSNFTNVENKASLDVVIEFNVTYIDDTSSPTIINNIRGYELQNITPNTVETWQPPYTFSGEAYANIFFFYPYAPSDLKPPESLTQSIIITDNSSTKETTHYENHSVNADYYELIDKFNIRSNSMIGCSYGKIYYHNMKTMSQADFFYEAGSIKPFMRFKERDCTNYVSFSNQAYRNETDEEGLNSQVAAFCTQFGDSLQISSGACKLLDGFKSSYPLETTITYSNNGLIDYSVNKDKPHIDVLKFNTSQEIELNAIIFNLPRTQYYINDSDAIWNTIKTRTVVYGYGGNNDAISDLVVPQFLNHEFSYSDNIMTIENTTGENLADYTWSFILIRPTITVQGNKITVDPKTPMQNVKVFASTTNDSTFESKFDNVVYGRLNDNGQFELEINYLQGEKYRVYLWDTFMSVSIKSNEMTA